MPSKEIVARVNVKPEYYEGCRQEEVGCGSNLNATTGHTGEALVLAVAPFMNPHAVTIEGLANEVIALIFQFFVGNDNASGPLPISLAWGAFGCGVHIVSRVCRRWREVALATASLWSHIYLLKSSSKTRVATYLQHSRNHPLNVWVDLMGGETSTVHFQRSIWPLLIPHLHRIRRLLVISNDVSLWQDVSSALRAVPTSSTLSLRAAASDPFASYALTTPVLASSQSWAPNILSEGGSRFLFVDPISVHYCRPPLTEVVHLRLHWAWLDPQHPYSPPFAIDVLNHILALPCLETLELSELFFSGLTSHPHRSTPLEARMLKHFRTTDGTLLARYFLFNVVAPLLESVTLQHIDFDRYDNERHDDYHFPSLHTLTLSHPRGFHDMIDLSPLTVCRAATHLAVKLDSCASEFLSGLSDAVEDFNLLPNVTEVTLFEKSPDGQATQAQESIRQIVEAFQCLTTLRVREARRERLIVRDWRDRDITIATIEDAYPRYRYAFGMVYWAYATLPWPLPRVSHRWETVNRGGRGRSNSKKVLKTDIQWLYDVRELIRSSS